MGLKDIVRKDIPRYYDIDSCLDCQISLLYITDKIVQ